MLSALTLTAVVVGIATWVLQYSTSVFRRRIIYGLAASARLIDPSVARSDLHVVYRDEKVADPHVTEIDLSYRGRRDIPKASFEGQPFCIDLGVRIVDLLEAVFEPKEAPVPRVEAVGTSLEVGPGLVRRGQAMSFIVLTDGSGSGLTHESPLADIKVRQEAPFHARQDVRARSLGGLQLRKIATWAIVLFIAYYLFTQPAGVAGFKHNVYSLLNNAGQSLAAFLNSL